MPYGRQKEMPKKSPSQKDSGTAKKLWLVLAVAVVLLTLGILVAQQSAPVEGSVSDIPTYTAKEGPLWVTVVETGTIKARDPVVLKCEVAWANGPPQILWLVPEGQEVKKGDLLVRLDSSLWENQQLERDIWDQQTEAGLIMGREGLKVKKSQTQSDIDGAELTLVFAKKDLIKYIEGDFPNQLKDAQRQVKLAEASRAAMAVDLHGKERLFERNFVTQIELDTARRHMQRTELQLGLAEGQLELLTGFTYQRNVTQLESDIEEAERNLERTKLKAAADIVKAEAGLAKTEHWARFGARQTAKIRTQIKNCEIYAPVDGTVLYANAKGWQPLEEGQTVYEHQELIHLLDDTSVMAEINIGESDAGKVKVDQRVRLTVDALPGMEFTGHIESIAIMPDAERSWMGSGPNVYATEIFIDGDGSALRTGMSCQAEIVVEYHEKAVSIPVEAVIRVRGRPTVYVVADGRVEERAVELGMANTTMIRVSSNLAAGERVLLAPPLDEATVFHEEALVSAQGELVSASADAALDNLGASK